MSKHLLLHPLSVSPSDFSPLVACNGVLIITVSASSSSDETSSTYTLFPLDRSLLDFPRTSESPVSQARPLTPGEEKIMRINEEGVQRFFRGLPEIFCYPQTDRPGPTAYHPPGPNASQKKWMNYMNLELCTGKLHLPDITDLVDREP